MPVVIRVTFKGIRDVNRTIDRMNRRFKHLSADKFADQVVRKAQAVLRKRYNYSRKAQRTGRLEASIHKEVRGTSARIIADTEYAPIVEEGRGPIYVRKPEFMAFTGREGEVVFTQKVRATKGKKFMEEARAWAKRYFPEYMRRKVNRIVASRGHSEFEPLTNINASSLVPFNQRGGGRGIGTVRSAKGLLRR